MIRDMSMVWFVVDEDLLPDLRWRKISIHMMRCDEASMCVVPVYDLFVVWSISYIDFFGL